MKWKKVSPELVELLDEAASPYEAEKRKMFGSPCYFVNRNMWTGAHQDSLFIRLDEDGKEALFSEGGKPFEPMKGRVMREYGEVPESIYSEQASLKLWLDRSYEYVSSLPPKEPKKKKKK